MKIIFNGYIFKLNKALTINELISYLGLNKDLIVIELNQKIIPKNFWISYFLKENDKLEILSVVGGG